MSWLTVIARQAGLGSLLDLIEAAEKSPSVATVTAAITAGVGELPKLPDVAVETAGAMASQLLIETATRVNPRAGALAGTYVPTLMQKLEAFLESELSSATGGLIPGPQAAMQLIA